MSTPRFEKCDVEGVWAAQGDGLGPTVAVLGGVHGDEPTGIEIVRQSLERLNFDCGTVILMLGNLAAMGKSRFVDVNLNRSFRELTADEEAQDPAGLAYEVRRAQELVPYLQIADAALDLHDFTNPSPPFIICEMNAEKTAKAIGAPIISFGWSQTEPGGSDGYMFERGKQGLCYELGQKTDPLGNLARGHGAVKRFLIANHMLYESVPPMFANPDIVRVDKAFIRKAEQFEIARGFANFEALQEGELIAVHDGEEIRAEAGQVIIFPEPDAPIDSEAFTLGRLWL